MDKQLADNSEIRLLSRLSPAISVFTTAIDWLIIFFAVYLHVNFPHPLIYLVSWFLIGSRMYALYSLLHEGIHYLHFRDKSVNDLFTRIFHSWPLGISLSGMRKAHLQHHRHLRTDQDPEMVHLKYDEFHFPKRPLAILWIFLKDLSGINYIYYFFKKLIGSISAGRYAPPILIGTDSTRWLLYAAVVAVVIATGTWKALLLYWIYPYISIYQAFNRLRLSTEHFNLGNTEGFQTRTVKAGIPEKFILSPHNLGYHTEHHLYPSVPFYKLPELHNLLMKSEEFNKNVLTEKSYSQVIKHCVE